MFEPEILQPSLIYSDNFTSLPYDVVRRCEIEFDARNIGCQDFSSLDTTPQPSPDFSFPLQDLEYIYPQEYTDVQVDQPSVTLSNDDFSTDFEERNVVLTDEIDNMLLYLIEGEDIEDEWSLNLSMDATEFLVDFPNDGVEIDNQVTLIQPSLNLPTEGAEIDIRLILFHLVMAYGQAIENGHKELASAVVKHVNQTVSLVGNIMERLFHYSFSLDMKSDYLKLECKKNFYAAYMAFYQIFPYGKFAHFAANSAILNAIHNNAKIIHIYDFDLGDGLQWCSIIEALGHQQRELRLTAIKWSEGESTCIPQEWKFEETKRRLHDHSRSCNLNLKVDEMTLQDFTQLKKIQRGGDEGEWCAFNCMTSLPHMGRARSRKNVTEFLWGAKEIMKHTCSKGIITFGDGDAWEKQRMSSNFTAFLDGHFMHYQALLESIELTFPVHLKEARTLMECLFVAPFTSSHAQIQKWEETRECRDLESAGLFELEGWNVSEESLMEAKEMIKEGESPYGVKIKGECNNQLVLDWRGTELVKVSCWQS
ncbi:nodulation-signaling pathway 2 protein-like [Heracleum sosnowskyi]|uniref:Nodulation-signaling pathway 2 protein-like n=1 Tax=Heracleum sosnowskyi TaxID=360622 RepID=A0AAD8LX34_9APIA|nr:nodulation-signaling pathway 2 protein-like [Heracleum sosnowskyi]